jgi:predicted HTH domain antitoxin
MPIPIEEWTTTDSLLLDEEQPLPETASVEEAIALFLADQCSLGRAAELAGVTRWDIQDILKARAAFRS